MRRSSLTRFAISTFGLAGFGRKAFAKAFGAWVVAVDGRVFFGGVIRLGQGSIAHGVFGVLQTAAFEVDVLCDAHFVALVFERSGYLYGSLKRIL